MSRYKIFLCTIVSMCACLSVTVFASAIADEGKTFPLGDGAAGAGEKSVDFWKTIKEKAIDPTESVSEKIQKALGIDYGDAKDQRATYFVQRLINRFLGIIGLVALIVLIYGFYQMFTAGDNSAAYDHAMKVVKWAALALFVIGLSRYIVSLLFDIYFTAKEDI